MTVAATVLAYHAVGDVALADDPFSLWVPTEAFARQLAYLAERRQVVPLADVVAGRVGPGKPAVAITFDDAYRSVLETAGPLLERYGFPSTVFTPTACVGDQNRWDPPSAVPLEIMDEDELRAAEAMGIAVESHGHHHVNLSEADEAAAEADLAPSIERLSAIVGRRPEFLAFPFRTGSPAAQRTAERLGFRAAFSIDLPHAGTYAWGRVGIAPNDSMALFGVKTSGRYLALRHNAVLNGAYQALRRLKPRR